MEQKKSLAIKGWTKLAVVSGLYIAISLLLAPLSFNAIQIRFSEIFNHLVIFNKRYLYAVTLGCLIVNFFSPFGMPDVLMGTLATFVSCSLAYFLAKKTNSLKRKYLYSTLSQLVGVFIIALELKLFFALPFWFTALTVGLGEMFSMILGIYVIQMISKQINLKE